jgi:transposase
MKRFVEGPDRGQSTVAPECLDEWVEESNSVRGVDSFVDGLDLTDLGFAGVEPAATGRPAYHPSVLLKLLRLSQPGAVEPPAGIKDRNLRKRLQKFCRISTLKSSNVPIRSADLWFCPNAGSSSAPLVESA